MLRKGGYNVITHKTKYSKKQGIPDPQIIADCGTDNLILLTADAQLETLWASEIQQARIAVVILANNVDGSKAWGQRLKAGRADIIAKLNKFKKPCAIRFGVHARVSAVRLYGPKRANLITI